MLRIAIAAMMFGALVPSVSAKGPAKNAPEIVVIHLGEKPANLEEGMFPHIKFYYTPGITVTKVPKTIPAEYQMEGKPEFLVDWNNKGYPIYDRGILFDKEGVAAFDGHLGRAEYVSDAICRKSKDKLDKVLTNIVKKGKKAKADKRKFKNKDKKGLVGLKLSEFEVADAAGKTYSVNSIITGGEKPVLVVFAHYRPDAVFTGEQAKKAAGADKAKSKGAFLGGFAKMALKGAAKEKFNISERFSTPKVLSKLETAYYGYRPGRD